MDIKEVCRTCLRPSGTLMSIFDSIQAPNLELPQLPVLEILKNFTQISGSRNDGFPENICRECFDKAHKSNDFKLKFAKSEAIWKRLMGNEKSVEELIRHRIEYEYYSEVNLDLLETEKLLDCATLNDEKLERTSLSKGFESGIMEQEVFLVQEVKEESEIEINVNEGDFDETNSSPKCPKSACQYQRKIRPKTQNRKTKFKCTICQKPCVSNTQLNRHMIKHSRGGPFQCGVCLKKIRYKSKLERHMKIIHGNETKFICTECPRICVNNSQLNRHMLIHTRNGTFKCDVCLKKFCYKRNLNLHMKREHGDETKMKFKCTKCSKLYLSRHELNQHMIAHTEVKPFKCKLCQKNFKHVSSLIYHMKMEHADRKFKCTTCSKLFVRKSELNRHMIIHTGEKPFQCEICLKKFTYKRYLIVHKKIIHDDKESNKFKCGTCSKLFRHKSSLKLHIRTHTGEKPFECEVCSMKFPYKNNLTIHLQKAHDDETTMNFKCTTCSKLFVSKSKLIGHMIIHTGEKPFQCEVCLNQFCYKRNLDVHMKTVHCDEKRKSFKCAICSKLYKHKCSLKLHVRVHTGEKPFQCEVCSRKFLDKNYLKAHMRRIHGVKSQSDKNSK